MANGTAALQLLTPELPSAPVGPTEAEIGKAAAAAVIALAMAVTDYADRGAMSASTRTWCGGMLGHLVELNLAHFGEDGFHAIVHRAGKRALQAHPARGLLGGLGAGQVDATFDMLLDYVLIVTDRVTADELARAN